MIAFIPLMLLLVGGSMVCQEFLPSVLIERESSTLQVFFLLPWVTFYALSLALPYPLMLLFALVTGFLWDARTPVYLDPEEFRIGTTVAFFALFGSLTQGIRPLFRKGHWVLPIMMVGAAVFLHLISEFVLICFVRGSFVFSSGVWYKVVLSTAVATLTAPFLLYLISRAAKKCGYKLEHERFTFRRASYGYQV